MKTPKKFYRSDTGYEHELGTTAFDVVQFEQVELGNNYGIRGKNKGNKSTFYSRSINGMDTYIFTDLFQ